jgi:hypothetical protein
MPTGEAAHARSSCETTSAERTAPVNQRGAHKPSSWSQLVSGRIHLADLQVGGSLRSRRKSGPPLLGSALARSRSCATGERRGRGCSRAISVWPSSRSHAASRASRLSSLSLYHAGQDRERTLVDDIIGTISWARSRDVPSARPARAAFASSSRRRKKPTADNPLRADPDLNERRRHMLDILGRELTAFPVPTSNPR